MSAPPTASSVTALARDRLRAAPGTPLVTFVDHTTGERTELSAATLDNWASKTANLLVEEYDLAPGDRVGLLAGPHWSTAAVLLGCWKAGACVVPGVVTDVRLAVIEEAAGVVAADGLTREARSADPGIEEAAGVVAAAGVGVGVGVGVPIVVVGAGMGARLTGPLPASTPSAIGYGEEVLAFADDYDDPDVDAGTAAALLDGVRLTQGNLLAAVAALGAWGLGGGGRVLVTAGPEAVEGLLGVLGPLSWGGSCVVVRDADPERLWATIAAEGVTAAVLPASLLDRLGPPPGETSLQLLLCPSGVARDVAARTGERTGVPVATGHGLVAAACTSSLVPASVGEDTRAWVSSSAASTAGPPVPGAEVTVESPGSGGEVEDGQRGEVVVRGPMVTPDAGGALRTGDEGYVETGPDGLPWLFLTGRV